MIDQPVGAAFRALGQTGAAAKEARPVFDVQTAHDDQFCLWRDLRGNRLGKR